MLSIRPGIRRLLVCVLAAPAVVGGHSRSPGAEGRADRWVDWRVCGPLVVRAEFALTGWDRVLGDLARLQGDLQRHLGIPPAGEPIEVYLFGDKPSYSAFVKRHLGDVPYRRALYVKRQGPGQVFAYRSRESATDLRHECTHALLHAALPMVPLWLDEGLAEYFEVPPEKRASGNPHLRALRWNLLVGNVPRLEILEKKGYMEEMDEADYRYAWAWVHFMLLGPKEAREELAGYLADIRAKSPPGVLSWRLRRSVPAARSRLAAHFKSWRR